MTHPVRFISAARAELERAQDWYEAQRPGLGTQFVERVDEAVAKIAKHPEAYQQIINDVRRAAIPQCSVGLLGLLLGLIQGHLKKLQQRQGQIENSGDSPNAAKSRK